MALMEYDRAYGMVDRVSDMVHAATGLRVSRNDGTTDGRLSAGLYHDRNDRIWFGTKALAKGSLSGSVPYTDVASMCKQQLHEYCHWQQRQFFRGLQHDPSIHGLPALPFGDDAACRSMARQRLISAEFPAYQRQNQFILPHERDAEEYALTAAPGVLEAVGFPKAFIEPCLVEEINRRRDWYGDRPVGSIAEAIADLHVKKAGPCLAELPLEYPREELKIVANSFLKDDKAQEAYSGTKPEDRDAFLIDYIGRRDPRAFDMYANIKDEMPMLRPYEIMKRKAYRLRTWLPDENAYDGPDGPDI